MKQIKWIILLVCVIAGVFCGCSAVPASGKTMPSGGSADVEAAVLTVNGRAVTSAEFSVYLYLMQKPYEDYYGSDIWKTKKEDGTPWEEWLMEEVRRQIVQMEILSRQAEKEGIALTDEEKQFADAAADAALNQMGDAAGGYGISASCIRSVYEKSKLAGIYYETAMAGYDFRLSEKELAGCRAMTVQQIFIAEEDAQHLKKGQTQLNLAEALAKRAVEGEDFETLSKAYSSDNAQWIFSFDENGYVFDTNGWLEEKFADKAWLLDEGEISSVIHTSYGYHVLKCAAVDTESLKQQAEEKKISDKKEAAFSADYEKWQQDVVVTEEAAWRKMHVLEGV